jgi:hypothetical protein
LALRRGRGDGLRWGRGFSGGRSRLGTGHGHGRIRGREYVGLDGDGADDIVVVDGLGEREAQEGEEEKELLEEHGRARECDAMMQRNVRRARAGPKNETMQKERVVGRLLWSCAKEAKHWIGVVSPPSRIYEPPPPH